MKTKRANIAFFVPHEGCPHACSFCDQRSISGQRVPLTPEDIIRTLEGIDPKTLDPDMTELAFFGGSFTCIGEERMVSYLEAANKFRDSRLFKGIRISTRPDAVSDEILRVLKEYAVTSIELGAQSTDESVLAFNTRGHTAKDISQSSEIIKRHGFSLGLQMMTGLYKSSPAADIKTCEDIIALQPDTVRIYPTVVLKKTRLEKLYKSGEYAPETLKEAIELCAKLLRRFYDGGITVIRTGLHSGGGVNEGFVAGPYHPAFGELCENAIYLDEALKKLCVYQKGEYILTVGESEKSKMTGQKKANIIELQKRGYLCKVEGESTVKRYDIRIRENVKR